MTFIYLQNKLDFTHWFKLDTKQHNKLEYTQRIRLNFTQKLKIKDYGNTLGKAGSGFRNFATTAE